MSGWTMAESDRIGRATEFDVASRRGDGTLSPFVTIWGVRSGNNVYVRSAYGPDNGWYRRAKRSGMGRLRVGDVERDVRFAEPLADVQDAIDGAYHTKYDRYGPAMVASVVGQQAAAVTRDSTRWTIVEKGDAAASSSV
jgi:hypothetical protein